MTHIGKAVYWRQERGMHRGADLSVDETGLIRLRGQKETVYVRVREEDEVEFVATFLGSVSALEMAKNERLRAFARAILSVAPV